LHAKKVAHKYQDAVEIVSNNNVMRLNANHDSVPAVANSEIIWKRDVKQN
jgi:hypothetical protein